jgi:small redox-active disulfide protein 2
MALFGSGKKKENTTETKSSCCCGRCAPEDMAQAEDAKKSVGVKVLGSGCPKCNQLEAATKEALAELGMHDEIEHVRDFAQIAAYGVMSTPALVVDGKVVFSYGKVLKKDEVVRLLKDVRGK